MSKARTLADFISDGSEFADGTISVAEVSGAAPLASPTFSGTVNISSSENNVALFDSSHSTSTQMFLRNTNTGTGLYTVLGFAPSNSVSGATITTYAEEDFSEAANRTARLEIDTRDNGNWLNRLTLGRVEAVFNDDSDATDFRVESDTNAHALFVDAGNSRIGLFNSSPSAPLHLLAGSSGGSLSDAFQIGDGSYTNIAMYSGGADGEIRVGAAGVLRGAYKAQYAGTRSSNDFHVGVQDTTGMFTIDGAGSALIINERSADTNFRVESNNNANMLFLDAGGDHVNIGTSSDRGGILNVYGSVHPIAVIESESDGTVLSLRCTDTDANHGPSLELYRNATGAAGDNLGSILIKGTDASAQDQVYFSIGTQISAAGNGVEASTVYIQNAHAGSLRERITIGQGAIVINQEGLDTDFRVEGDANSNLFFVDAGFNSGQGAIGIGTGSPSRASGFGGNQTVLHMAGCSVPEIRLTSSTSGQGDLSIFAHNSGAGAKIVNANGGIELSRGGTNQLTVSNGVVINEDSYDYDFRIESDNNTHAFYVDGGNGAKYFGTGTNQGTTGAGTFNIVVHGGDAFNLRHLVDGNHLMNLNQDGTTTYNAIHFSKNGVGKGQISVSTSAVSYNTSSDYRLKENVVALTGATTRLKQLEPKRFNFISDPDDTVDGFLAHEVQSVVPEAITGTHNEVDADGNPVYQGIDQAKLVPLLVATIKELEARITALESA